MNKEEFIKKSIEDLKEMVNKSRDLREEEFYKLIGIHNIQAIATVLAYIEELENKLKIQTENYNSAYEDINWLCGKRNGKTVELALILRKEILKLPEGRTYGIRRCKYNIYVKKINMNNGGFYEK